MRLARFGGGGLRLRLRFGGLGFGNRPRLGTLGVALGEGDAGRQQQPGESARRGAMHNGIRRLAFSQPPPRHVGRTAIHGGHFATLREHRAAVASGGDHGIVQNQRHRRLVGDCGHFVLLAHCAFGKGGGHIASGLRDQRRLRRRLAPHASGVHAAPGSEAVLGERQRRLRQAIHRQQRHIRSRVGVNHAGRQFVAGIQRHDDDAIFVRHAVGRGGDVAGIGDGEARANAAHVAGGIQHHHLDDACA